MILQHFRSFVLFISCLWSQRYSSKKGKKKAHPSKCFGYQENHLFVQENPPFAWRPVLDTHTQTHKGKIPNDQKPPASSLPCKICLPAHEKARPGEGELLTEKMPLIFLELQEHWYNCCYDNSTYKRCWTLGIEILVAVFEALFINACKMLCALQLLDFYRENLYTACSRAGLNPQLKAKAACHDKQKGCTVP